MQLIIEDGYQLVDGGVCAAAGFVANGCKIGRAHV